MNKTVNPLSEKELQTVRGMRAQGFGFDAIARKLKRNYYQVRSAVDPEWRQQQLQRNRVAYQQAKADDVEEAPRPVRNPEYDPVRDGPPVYASPFAELMGDPPIGRRALDMRRDA